MLTTAKEAAPMVLGVADFSSIEASIEVGRAILENIKRFVARLLFCTAFLVCIPACFSWDPLLMNGLPVKDQQLPSRW